MNENESGIKRPQELAHMAENDEHKKQKTSDDKVAAVVSPPSPLPPAQPQPQPQQLLPATLVLDKAQEDTINDLVNNSNAAASLLQQSIGN